MNIKVKTKSTVHAGKMVLDALISLQYFSFIKYFDINQMTRGPNIHETLSKVRCAFIQVFYYYAGGDSIINTLQ